VIAVKRINSLSSNFPRVESQALKHARARILRAKLTSEGDVWGVFLMYVFISEASVLPQQISPYDFENMGRTATKYIPIAVSRWKTQRIYSPVDVGDELRHTYRRRIRDHKARLGSLGSDLLGHSCWASTPAARLLQ